MADKDKPENKPPPASDFARDLYARLIASMRPGEVTPERCQNAKVAALRAADAWETATPAVPIAGKGDK